MSAGTTVYRSEPAEATLTCGDSTVAAEWSFDARDPVTGTMFAIVRCTACGLTQTLPTPHAAELDRYYTRGYHRSVRRYRLGLDRVLSLVHAGRIRRIERLAGGVGSVLDVGCGPGVLLDEMRRRGWRTTGTERSAEAARQARDVFHLDVDAVDVAELAATGVMFDAVVLWHVAEHLQAPAQTLHHIARLVRPGGVLLIAVPNFASPEATIARRHWFHLDVPRHLFHFTPRTLSALVTEAGFTPRRFAYRAPEYDAFSFVQTVENWLGLRPNLLYNVLRREESRLSRPNAGPLATAVAVGLALPLTVAALLWTPIAAALRRGATVTIYAQRTGPRQRVEVISSLPPDPS